MAIQGSVHREVVCKADGRWLYPYYPSHRNDKDAMANPPRLQRGFERKSIQPSSA